MSQKVHVWECAKARVEVAENGEILTIEDPPLEYCPIRKALGWHSELLCSEDIRKSLQWKIDKLGMCKKNRILQFHQAGIGYGASECFMTALDNDLLDAAVVACEGGGTVISDDKTIIQGIGMPMSALVSTFPIPEIIKKLEKLGATVLDKESAKIDQIEGLKKAIELDYKKIGVTIAGPNCKDVEILRKIEKEHGVKLLINLVHTTGVNEEDEKYIVQCDISHSCSSKVIRAIMEPKNLHLGKFGTKIPVYTFTEFGQKVLELRSEEMKKTPPMLKVGDKVSRDSPHPLI